MEPQHRKIWPAATLLILAAAAAVFCLFRLSQPDRMQTSLSLNCTPDEPERWTFETESGPVEPVFGLGGYLDGIPVDGDSRWRRAGHGGTWSTGSAAIFWLWCGDTGVSGW